MRKSIFALYFIIFAVFSGFSPLSAQSKGGPWVFALNLDTVPRSIQIDPDPGLYSALLLPPAAASQLKMVSQDQPHSLLTSSVSGEKLLPRRNSGGQIYQYRFLVDHVYALVLLPDNRLEVVQLKDKTPDASGSRVILANALDQEVQDFQIGSEWQKNVLVRLAALPAKTVANPARLTWAAAYGAYHSAGAEGKFTALAAGQERPLFADGTWWVAVAGPKGIQVSKIQ